MHTNRQTLRRSFGLWQLTAYGLNYMIPIAPAIVFGFVLKASGGTVVLPYLFALLGTLFTASAYAYFVKRYPYSGSAYNYVAASMGRHLGFLAGWAILLDYLVIPTVTAMSASAFLHNLTGLPYEPTLLVFIAAMGLLNLIGSAAIARLGLVMLIIGELMIFSGFFVWAHAVYVHHVGVGSLLSAEPFHFSSFAALTAATSIGMASYLGFDAITTLAEEAKRPARDIPRAIFLSLFIGAFTMIVTGYLASLVVPNWQQYMHDTNWLNTALFYVSQTTGGHEFVLIYTIGFVLAMGVFNIVSTMGASRVLFGMSRDRVIPVTFLSSIAQSVRVPAYAVITITIVQMIIGSLCGIALVAEVVNFGALFGFSLLNVAFLVHMQKYAKQHGASMLLKVVPLIGAVINVWILVHLSGVTLLVGLFWLLLGILLYALGRFHTDFNS